MAYIDPKDVKKRVMTYLYEYLDSDKKDVDPRKLTFDAIKDKLNDIPPEKIKNVLDTLSGKEIGEYKTGYTIYIPTELVNRENLKPLRLESPYNRIVKIFIIGILTLGVLSFYPPVKEAVLTVSFSTVEEIIRNSLAIGLFIPLGIGWALLFVYEEIILRILPAVSPLRNEAILVIFSYAISIFGFSLLIDKSDISTAIQVGTGLAILLVTLYEIKQGRKTFKLQKGE